MIQPTPLFFIPSPAQPTPSYFQNSKPTPLQLSEKLKSPIPLAKAGGLETMPADKDDYHGTCWDKPRIQICYFFSKTFKKFIIPNYPSHNGLA